MQPNDVAVTIPEVIQQIPLNYYLIFSTALFVIGIIGLVLEYALIRIATAFTFEEVKS